MEAYKKELTAFVNEGEATLPRLVMGEGPLGATVMLVGEAPGGQEEQAGRPFVGKAGQNLNRFLELAGLAREEVYITNAVKFRPTRVGKTGRIGNRPPTSGEIARFQPWLLREIRLIRPRIIVTLGNVPLRAVTGKALTIGQVHGTVLEDLVEGTQVFALYHPASIIYNRALADVYEADVRKLGAVCKGK